MFSGDQERFNFDGKSILQPISSATGTNLVQLLNPNFREVGTDEGLTYTCFITYLTAVEVRIPSLKEVYIPPIPENAPAEDVQKIFDEVAKLANYKKLELLSGFEGGPVFHVATIPLFYQAPFYRFSLMPFWSGTNNTLDLGTNFNGAAECLYARMIDPLINDDYVFIRGSCIRRPNRRPITKNLIFNSYQRTVQEEATVLASASNREYSTFVNYSFVPIGSNSQDYVIWLKRGTDAGAGIPLNPGGSTRVIQGGDQIKAYSVAQTQLAIEEAINGII